MIVLHPLNRLTLPRMTLLAARATLTRFQTMEVLGRVPVPVLVGVVNVGILARFKMQIGDLVTYYFQLPRWRKGQSVHVGLIVETGKYTGNKDVKVMWQLMGDVNNGKSYLATEASQHLTLVDDISLTT
tara:strand:+ start:3462 stop:3848 length:387 start_codon:yes stop_codon:yes gene_type:complete